MADIFTKAKRSWVMSRVRGANTTPERTVRSFLHRRGFRFRVQRNGLPGHPDIVLPKFKTVVFVNGCFWHGHPGCKRATIPSTRRAFWLKKITGNRERDVRTRTHLRRLGWKVVTVWECQVRIAEKLERGLRPLLRTALT